jgi:hypothetical protein
MSEEKKLHTITGLGELDDIVSAKEGSSIAPCPEGSMNARILAVGYLGEEYSEKYDKTSQMVGIVIQTAIPLQDAEGNELEDKGSYCFYKKYSFTTTEKSKLVIEMGKVLEISAGTPIKLS